MRYVMTASLVALAWATTNPALASEVLARDNGCLVCHDATKKTMGPSIKDIAAKYKGKTGAVETIAANIKAGKGHPESKASDADLKAIVGWMLK